MKKNFTYLFLAALSIAASCSKTAAPSVPMEDFAISTEISKTVMTDIASGETQWTATDDISVFSTAMATPGNNHLTASSVSGGSAQFAGQVEAGTTTFVALYPYNSSASYSEGVISTEIPTAQAATANSFADRSSLALASGTKTPGTPEVDDIQFANLCASVVVTLPSNITFASQITVTANSGAKIAGAATVDCSTGILAATGSSSVVLSGSFVGGNKYCFSIAPGVYTGGFTFTIRTAGGATYVRENTADITARAGHKVSVGTLSLKMAEGQINSSVTISHDVVSNVLNGSSAKISLNVPSEFSPLVKWSVELYNSSVQLCRSYTGTGNVSAATMNVENGWAYLPSGSYTYVIKYTVNNGTKDITTTLSPRGAVSPNPSGFQMLANLGGYTSYSAYVGSDGQSKSTSTANSLDGSTVYGVSASYAGGFGFDITDTKYAPLFSLKYYYDDAETASGNKTAQSWGSHTLRADMTFDGVNQSASKAVYVTGLPFVEPFNNVDAWDRTNNTTKNGVDGFKLGGGTGNANATLKNNFQLPASTGVKVSSDYYLYSLYWGISYQLTTYTVKVGSTSFISRKSEKTKNTEKHYTDSKTGNISGSCQLYIESSYVTAGPYARVKNLSVQYN